MPSSLLIISYEKLIDLKTFDSFGGYNFVLH